MNLYQESDLKLPKISKKTVSLIVVVLILSFVGGFFGSWVEGYYFSGKSFLSPPSQNTLLKEKNSQKTPNESQNCISQEERVVSIVKKVSPAVVSIVIFKKVPVFEKYYYNPFKEFEEFFGDVPFEFEIPQYRQKGTEKKEVGGGTGFLISKDGLILTNKHVVADKDAEYTVITNDGRKFKAQVLARDPLNDLALLKVKGIEGIEPLKLGDSDKLELGQTVIAIGNALGEFRNTVSVGVVSGLKRTVSASGGGMVETLEDVIQTDAAINPGNSGGPLINLKGEVVGINTAMVKGAQNIGFAIPINQAKRMLEKVKKYGKIVYPFLGIRYVIIDEKLQNIILVIGLF